MNTVKESLQIPVAGVVLGADLVVPEQARGVVVFAHGSGSSRLLRFRDNRLPFQTTQS
jgi:hypothetical protein